MYGSLLMELFLSDLQAKPNAFWFLRLMIGNLSKAWNKKKNIIP